MYGALFPADFFEYRYKVIAFGLCLLNLRARCGGVEILIAEISHADAFIKTFGVLEATLEDVLVLRPFVFARAGVIVRARFCLAEGHSDDELDLVGLDDV